MDYEAAYPYAQDLTKNHPDTATNILARVCATDKQISSEIVRTTSTKSAQQRLHSKHEALRSSSKGLTLQTRRLPPVESSGSHCSNSPSHARSRSMQKQRSDASHAGSVSSRTSYSGNVERTPKEYAVLLILTTSGLQREVVQLKEAPIDHSVIRESVARRLPESDQMPSCRDECDVQVPRLNDPHHYDLITVSESMMLTWEHDGHNTTRKTEFNLVPDRMLDTDILFGKGNLVEGNSGVYVHSSANVPSAPTDQGYAIDRLPV